MIKRTEACEVFVLSAIVRPMRECFIGWRDFTQCKDGTEDGRLAYLRQRNARKLRLALVSNALPMDAQLAFLMASHASRPALARARAEERHAPVDEDHGGGLGLVQVGSDAAAL